MIQEIHSFVFLVTTVYASVETSESPCMSVNCSSYGTCEQHKVPDGANLELCVCQRHFSGRDCSHPNIACDEVNCRNGASCEIGKCLCTDSSLYTGEDCSKVHCDENGEITEMYCKNGGLCHKGVCVCPNNTKGDHCEIFTCGEFDCTGGYCSVDKCICDAPCMHGCDTTKGTCLDVPLEATGVFYQFTHSNIVLLAAISILVAIIILPALYAMHNIRVENKEKHDRIKAHMDMERKYHEHNQARHRQRSTMKTENDYKAVREAAEKNPKGVMEHKNSEEKNPDRAIIQSTLQETTKTPKNRKSSTDHTASSSRKASIDRRASPVKQRNSKRHSHKTRELQTPSNHQKRKRTKKNEN